MKRFGSSGAVPGEKEGGAQTALGGAVLQGGTVMKSCHRCGGTHDDPGQPGFNNLCRSCGMPLHACANCRHYVPRGSVRCLQVEAPKVLDPRAANRCTLFEFVGRTMEDAKAAAAEFENGDSKDGRAGSASPRDRWDRLFEAEQ